MEFWVYIGMYYSFNLMKGRGRIRRNVEILKHKEVECQ